MAKLTKYNEKRDFEKTPEPKGEPVSYEEKNRFVVQRHLARREHYDFRLQLENVLVSWAIPKKPVYDPSVKRLAIKVEDHPLSYIHFEGNIPKGNYGAGTVMVWDLGYYYLGEDKSFPEPSVMKKKLSKGSLKLYLQGAKLKGYFNLVKASGSDKDEWFFMKASENDDETDFEDKSALTGNTMDEIKGSTKIWNSNAHTSEANEENTNNDIESTLPAKKKKTSFPGFIKPMLATLTKNAFSDKEWIYEFKFDGYRTLATKDNDKVKLFSRNENDFTKRFSIIAEELEDINAKFVIDGEVCFMEDADSMNFQKLQNIDNEPDKLHYFIFDLLWLNGHDLTKILLTERKKLLSIMLKDPPEHIHYVDHIIEKGKSFFSEIEKKKQEGIIAKRASSKYYPGSRSDDWLKIKTGFRQEMIICGFSPSEKESRPFSSLLCCVNDNNKLIYTGRVGTGFSERLQKDILNKLKKLVVKKPPVENPPSTKNIVWVKPELLCDVKFSSWTKDKIMRHPSFIGLRTDKEAKEIKLEKPVKTPKEDSLVQISNPDKIFWPDEGFTKGNVIDYYNNIADTILPYLKDRPQSLYRTPNGIEGKGFFQKNVEKLAPEWTDTVTLDNSKGGTIEYLLCQNKDTLLYMANLGCIEINPWSSSLPDLDKPDFMIFDLDPVDIGFEKVIQIAQAFKKLFDQLSMPSYCKTSGSRGIHIYVPVIKKYTYPQVQKFVKIMQQHIHNQFKSLTSFERSPSKRKGKIYLDYLQNAKGKTMSSVYSLRPRPGAPVSAPVHWDEVKKGLTPTSFNIKNMPKRLEKVGDLWQDIFDNRVDMEKILGQMSNK